MSRVRLLRQTNERGKLMAGKKKKGKKDKKGKGKKGKK
jgi:hypothetical protein